MRKQGEWLFVIVACITLFACATTSERAALNTSADFYTITVSTLADYHEYGVISDKDKDQIDPIRVRARVALNAWREAVDRNDPLVWDSRQQFNDALSKLIEAQQQAERHDE